MRFGRVISVEKTNSFETSAAKWDRLTAEFSDDYDGDVSDALVLKVFRKGWFGGGVLEWAFYNELAPRTPGAHVCPVYDGGIDHNNKICHLLMADLSRTHTEPPMNAKDRPHGGGRSGTAQIPRSVVEPSTAGKHGPFTPDTAVR